MMKNAAQPDRVKGLERASLTATVWLVFDHGAQLRSKVQSGIYPNQPCCECLHLIKMNCLALWLDESAHASLAASCEELRARTGNPPLVRRTIFVQVRPDESRASGINRVNGMSVLRIQLTLPRCQ
jgi:hypothetical protein